MKTLGKKLAAVAAAVVMVIALLPVNSQAEEATPKNYLAGETVSVADLNVGDIIQVGVVITGDDAICYTVSADYSLGAAWDYSTSSTFTVKESHSENGKTATTTTGYWKLVDKSSGHPQLVPNAFPVTTNINTVTISDFAVPTAGSTLPTSMTISQEGVDPTVDLMFLDAAKADQNAADSLVTSVAEGQTYYVSFLLNPAEGYQFPASFDVVLPAGFTYVETVNDAFGTYGAAIIAKFTVPVSAVQEQQGNNAPVEAAPAVEATPSEVQSEETVASSKKSPRTGDNSGLLVMICLMSAAVAVTMAYSKKSSAK